MRTNFLKEKLKEGKTVLGIWNTIASTSVTDILASTGVDFLMIDFEHGPFDITKVKDYVNACEVYNVSPIVRILTLLTLLCTELLSKLNIYFVSINLIDHAN